MRLAQDLSHYFEEMQILIGQSSLSTQAINQYTLPIKCKLTLYFYIKMNHVMDFGA